MTIHRRTRLTGILFVLVLVTYVSGSAVAAIPSAPTLAGEALQQMRPWIQSEAESSQVSVHHVKMIASNAYLLETPEGLILVDAGIPYTERLVYRKMKQIGRDDLKLIFVTHAHIDHYGAANAIRKKTGAPIAIHRDDAAAMALGRTELGTVRDWIRLSDTTLPYIEPLLVVTPTKADILLEDGDSLEAYGVDAYVLHTPGHTPGSSTLMVNDEMAFVGDLLASGMKVHAQRSFAEDWLEVAHSLARLKDADPEVIYPGHGSDPIMPAQLADVDANFVEP